MKMVWRLGSERLLGLLSEKQQRTVIGPQIRAAKIWSSKEIVVLSRIGDVTTLPQKLAIFGRINKLDPKLLDFISCQEPALQEEVMQWPKCKLVKVANPNAVVYRRLGDAQKRSRSIEEACSRQSANAAATGNDAHALPLDCKSSQLRPQQEIIEELTLELLEALRRARRAEEDVAKLRAQVDDLRRAKKDHSGGTANLHAVPTPAIAA